MRQRQDVSAWVYDQAPPAYFIISASPILPIPLPVYMMCTFVGQLSVGIAFTTMSLAYGAELLLSFVDHLETHSDHSTDALAFSVIVFLVARSNVTKVPLPGILRIIARDATRYFLVIFTSHLVVVMFFWLASVSTPSLVTPSLLSMTRLYIYRTESSYFPPRK